MRNRRRMFRRRILKRIMTAKRWAVEPRVGDLELKETFDHEIYREASEEKRRALRLASAELRCKAEFQRPLDRFFGIDLLPLLEGGTLLDIGCFTGGKAAAYAERFRLRKVYGVDVYEDHVLAAKEFADTRGINAEFIHAPGEELPFPDAKFDSIVATDVFEHVQNVERVLSECHRVLKPGAKLLTVFPSFFGAREHHLSMVTRAPFIHYFFSTKTVIDVYNEILEERGEVATRWYRRSNPEPEPWESGHTINGMTKWRFRKLIRAGRWKIVLDRRSPPLAKSNPRDDLTKRIVRFGVWRVWNVLCRIPGLEEVFLSRIVYILEKR